MLKLKDKHYLQHNLQLHFEEIKGFKKKSTFLNSAFYQNFKTQINDILFGLEWDNTLSNKNESGEMVRLVSWNIERGKQLDGIINYFKEHLELSKADIILAIECDNGMGRTANRNVARELAEALGMNYCFAPSYLVLSKGALGETNHKEENTTALHGTAILSKFPIIVAKSVEVSPVKEVFHSSEKRLGSKKGLVVQIKINGKTIGIGAIHIDLSSDATDRAKQLLEVTKAIPNSDMQLVGGDFNCSTFNLRTKWGLFKQIVKKYFTVGFKGAIENYMTPEKNFDKPMFDILSYNGFDFNQLNNRNKGTIYFDINDILHNEKTKKFVPPFFMRYLDRKLKPWNGCVPLKIDWFAGKNIKTIHAETIEKPAFQNVLLSDHNPIFVDIEIK
jgi:endonuclease/exonuclease/phosphatase family metal-dependent hydrolase